jgi:hypothetical protein
MPPGERKSGIDAATEAPAPVNTTIDRHSGDRMSRASPATSVGATAAFMVDPFGAPQSFDAFPPSSALSSCWQTREVDFGSIVTSPQNLMATS